VTTGTPAGTAGAIAEAFVAARRAGRALPAYPGAIPADLAAAYAIQDAALARWPDRIAGWKIGRLATPELQARYNEERLAGPIFARAVRQATPGTVTDFPVFVGGFAAVEAEFVLRIARDADPAKLDWSLEEAAAMAGAMFGGIETAGSPLKTINELGPTVVISDFGNNAGLILGPEIADWRDRSFDDLACETFLGETSIGKGVATSVPGGPLPALRFLLEHCARSGRPLAAGQYVSTGAATGIHEIAAGETARISFPGYGEIACRAVAATGDAA
jgi:2-keto-4-pentenoate hydratase